MATYGETFKRLREQRGFMLKEVYTDILSRTTAYRFETGGSEIGTEKLVQLLRTIGIYSLDEFLFLHEQINQLTSKNLDLFVAKLIQGEVQESNTSAKAIGEKFYKKFRESPKKEERFYAYFIHYHFLTNQRLLLQPLPAEFLEEYQFMQNYLLSIESWNLRELENFSFLSSCFEPAARRTLLKRFKKNFQRYQDYFEDWADHYILHLVNYSMNTVLLKEYQDLTSELEEISSVMQNYPHLNWKFVHLIRYLFLEIITAAVAGNAELMWEKYQRLVAIATAVPEVGELGNFYVDYTRRIVADVDEKMASRLGSEEAGKC